MTEHILMNPADYEPSVEIRPHELAAAVVQFAEAAQALADAFTIRPPKLVKKDD